MTKRRTLPQHKDYQWRKGVNKPPSLTWGGPDQQQGEIAVAASEVQVLSAKTAELLLPARVKEHQYNWNFKRRDTICLLAGKGRAIIKKLNEGAHELQKML